MTIVELDTDSISFKFSFKFRVQSLRITEMAEKSLLVTYWGFLMLLNKDLETRLLCFCQGRKLQIIGSCNLLFLTLFFALMCWKLNKKEAGGKCFAALHGCITK